MRILTDLAHCVRDRVPNKATSSPEAVPPEPRPAATPTSPSRAERLRARVRGEATLSAAKARTSVGRGLTTGLQYFGKRYLNPLLGRWISADPLAVHAPGRADANVYAYVRGAILKAVDPLGLADTVKAPSQNSTSGNASVSAAAAGDNVSGYDENGGQITVFYLTDGPERIVATPAEEKASNAKIESASVDAKMQDAEMASRADPPKPPTLDELQELLDVWSLSLDATGLGAIVSWVPDTANAGIDLAQGDYEGAALSGAAALPILGATSNFKRLQRALDVGRENLRRFDSLNSARAAAKQWSGLGDDAVPFVQQLGPNKGRVSGMQSADGSRGWRLDFDPDDAEKGVHINWWDNSKMANKKDKANRMTGANTIDGFDEDDYRRLMEHFPDP